MKEVLLYLWCVTQSQYPLVSFHHAVARSPIYSHLSATLQGLPVIRSFSMQSVALDQFHKYQNQHSQAWYLYLITTRYYLMKGILHIIGCIYCGGYPSYTGGLD